MRFLGSVRVCKFGTNFTLCFKIKYGKLIRRTALIQAIINEYQPEIVEFTYFT